MKHILLVEDDTDLLRLYTRLLTTAGYHVTSAMLGRDAVARLEEAHFDLLLTDWRLPDLLGDAIITTAHARYPHMKTVLMSTHADVRAVALACHAHAAYAKGDVQALLTLLDGL